MDLQIKFPLPEHVDLFMQIESGTRLPTCKAQDLVRSMFLFSYLVSSKLFSLHLLQARISQAYIS